MTKIIGLTGGIGSGKTTIAQHFHSLGVPIYIADDAAREVMQDKSIIASLKKAFGVSIFDGEELNRAALASIVFNDSEKLLQLNAIVHPAVRVHFESWFNNHLGATYIIYEAAILFESGNYKKCNQVICVVAPLDTRIQRVVSRDNTDIASIEKRINSQWTDEQRINKSDYVIENVNLATAKLKVEEIHKILLIKQNGR
ncbi:dephospho-CoA kinase [Flavobacterium sp. 14A]|uniref:dephospho-CoA kinase n=1 Tax=Flavobacterium sp. 14A TaxID=2735896 RepID=UPI00156F3D69|nr:dephospho-CoA kinase [Flavobacterium sp. 14A]NRT12803.1 dephospho-CoA kinase [Flavobacterium sp. 14A]